MKNLEAVETLGSCSTICSDKTGTLTLNQMTVVSIYYDGQIWIAGPEASFSPDDPTFQQVQKVATLCNRATFDPDIENMTKPIVSRKTIGDASESALLKFCEPLRPVLEYRAEFPKLFEVPFNSTNKWQLSIHHDTKANRCVLVMKGAPERILDNCETILIKGEQVPIDDEHRKEIDAGFEKMTAAGRRVLGLAMLELPEKFHSGFEFDMDSANFPTKGLTFVGMVGLMDPPRPEVKEAVHKCKEAGIRVIMVTGDHPMTAVAIGREVGIIEGEMVEDIAKREGIPVDQVDWNRVDAVVVKGTDIDSLKDSDWDKILTKRQIIFARYEQTKRNERKKRKRKEKKIRLKLFCSSQNFSGTEIADCEAVPASRRDCGRDWRWSKRLTSSEESRSWLCDGNHWQ